MARIANNLTELIGNTPLMELTNYSRMCSIGEQTLKLPGNGICQPHYLIKNKQKRGV